MIRRGPATSRTRRGRGSGTGGLNGAPPPGPFLSSSRNSRHRGRQPAGPRRHLWPVILLSAVLTAGVLLGLLASAASEPSATARLHTFAQAARQPVHAVPPRPSYGSMLGPAAQRVPVKLKLQLSSGLLFDVRTGAVLWRLHQDRVVPMASLTKMMTALIVAARSRPTERVLITPQAMHFSGSGIGLLPLGKRVPLMALMYGLL